MHREAPQKTADHARIYVCDVDERRGATPHLDATLARARYAYPVRAEGVFSFRVELPVVLPSDGLNHDLDFKAEPRSILVLTGLPSLFANWPGAERPLLSDVLAFGTPGDTEPQAGHPSLNPLHHVPQEAVSKLFRDGDGRSSH